MKIVNYIPMKSKLSLLTLLTTAFVFLVSSAFAQKNYARKATEEFNNERFILAAEEFKKAYNKVPKINNPKKRAEKAYYAYMVGQCYRLLTEAGNAEQWYEKAELLKYPEDDQLDQLDKEKHSILYFWLAEVEREQGKYSEAVEHYKQFQKLEPADKRVEKPLEGAEKAKEFKKDNLTKHVVENFNRINTKVYDYDLIIGNRRGNQYIISSNREGSTGEGEYYRIQGGGTDLFVTDIDRKGNISEPVPLPAEVNTNLNEGTAVFDSRFNKMYFTRCPFEEKKKLGCDIYQIENKSGRWGEAIRMNIKDHDSTNVGHPALTNGDQTLVFASDMAGGFGGKDLWYTTYDRRSDSWSTPTNLGPIINTAGNEMFPYFDDQGNLYFASDGHFGLGGLDIFEALINGEQTEMKFEKPRNMGYPMNSERNDFAYIELPPEGKHAVKRGFLSSNRNGSTGGNIDDIWTWKLPPVLFQLTLIVRDQMTGEPVPNATVQINSMGENETNLEMTTDENGQLELIEKPDGDRYILKNTTYGFTVSKEEYLANDDAQITTVDLVDSYDFYQEVYIQPVTKEPLKMPEVRYDFGKAELQVNDSVNSKDSLNFLYDIMVENPTIIVQLRSHTDCRGSAKFNRDLAQRRAESCVRYLVDEKGIAEDRIVPKGMGEDEPLTIYEVSEGGDSTEIVLTCDYINKLPTEPEQEAAHQRNRRTDFKILSWDYVPKEDEGKEEEEEGNE